MSNRISHIGTVYSVSDGLVRVRIVQHSACVGCKAAAHCNSTESKEKLIDVRCLGASRYRVGQEVTVVAAQAVGAKAVVLGFVVPLIVLLVVVIGALQMGVGEAQAALAGIVALIPYYIILYMCRSKLDRMFTFYIENE